MESEKIIFKTFTVGGEVKENVIDIKQYRSSLEVNVEMCKTIEGFDKERENYKRRIAEMEKKLAKEKMSVARTERELKKEREEVNKFFFLIFIQF